MHLPLLKFPGYRDVVSPSTHETILLTSQNLSFTIQPLCAITAGCCGFKPYLIKLTGAYILRYCVDRSLATT